MTNEELFARQIHNLHNAVNGMALVLRQQLLTLPPPLGTVELLQHPAVTDLDRVMQSYHDTLTALTSIVQKANSMNTGSGIIVPH